MGNRAAVLGSWEINRKESGTVLEGGGAVSDLACGYYDSYVHQNSQN